MKIRLGSVKVAPNHYRNLEMPVLLKTDQGADLRYAFLDVFGPNPDASWGDIKLCFDVSGLRIMYYGADSVLKWDTKINAEDTETYKYSSEHLEMATSVKPDQWYQIFTACKKRILVYSWYRRKRTLVNCYVRTQLPIRTQLPSR